MTLAVYSAGKRRMWCRECARFHGKRRCPHQERTIDWIRRTRAEIRELKAWLRMRTAV